MEASGLLLPQDDASSLALARHLLSQHPGWHSLSLHILYESLGWFAFAVWSFSFYPQVILNYQRKSVVGFNFDFLIFNLTKHVSYLVFNVMLFFSPVVQQQYHQKYGPDALIPVAASDVGFSIHAVTLTVVTGVQILMYQRGGQHVSPACVWLTSIAWAVALLLNVYAWNTGDWLMLATAFNYIQLTFTSIKYIPQAYMNYQRKSTAGWSIGNILLDISGGLGSLAQMLVFSLDQKTIQNFVGNVGKLGLSLETIAFDLFFIVQHYILYPHRGGGGSHTWRERMSDDGSNVYQVIEDGDGVVRAPTRINVGGGGHGSLTSATP